MVKIFEAAEDAKGKVEEGVSRTLLPQFLTHVPGAFRAEACKAKHWGVAIRAFVHELLPQAPGERGIASGKADAEPTLPPFQLMAISGSVAVVHGGRA